MTRLSSVSSPTMNYRNEVQHLVSWCDKNNLVLNTKKTKEIIEDFRRNGPSNYRPLFFGSEAVESGSSFKLLGLTRTEELGVPHYQPWGKPRNTFTNQGS